MFQGNPLKILGGIVQVSSSHICLLRDGIFDSYGKYWLTALLFRGDLYATEFHPSADTLTVVNIETASAVCGEKRHRVLHKVSEHCSRECNMCQNDHQDAEIISQNKSKELTPFYSPNTTNVYDKPSHGTYKSPVQYRFADSTKRSGQSDLI